MAKYEIIRAKLEAPSRDLIKLSGDRELIASLEAFGPNYFDSNVEAMQRQYSHPQTGEIITFREPTTTESILAASYDFGNRAKPRIFDPNWLQAGRIVRTSEGVFANPPKNEEGNLIIDEKILHSYLGKTKPVKVGKGRICIVPNSEKLRDFGFADYDSFEQSVQDYDTFSNGGLARVLEHAEDEAKNFRAIASPKFYKREVNVWGFDSVKEPVLRVAGLYSYGGLDIDRLGVVGDWGGNSHGFAFGVFEQKRQRRFAKNK